MAPAPAAAAGGGGQPAKPAATAASALPARPSLDGEKFKALKADATKAFGGHCVHFLLAKCSAAKPGADGCTHGKHTAPKELKAWYNAWAQKNGAPRVA